MDGRLAYRLREGEDLFRRGLGREAMAGGVPVVVGFQEKGQGVFLVPEDGVEVQEGDPKFIADFLEAARRSIRIETGRRPPAAAGGHLPGEDLPVHGLF